MSVNPIISFEREEYKVLCEEMKAILSMEKELESRKKEVREQIIARAGGNRMEYGIKLTKRVTRGSVDYKLIAQNKIDSKELQELECFFTKADREFWEVRSY